mmetsp:Transcript_119924/g.208798  ORF Transcript_119924/g.208798 Transcript_119924/m.208798 type:complete len:92 (-) Transcript_119924:1019-1294(-)
MQCYASKEPSTCQGWGTLINIVSRSGANISKIIMKPTKDHWTKRTKDLNDRLNNKSGLGRLKKSRCIQTQPGRGNGSDESFLSLSIACMFE